MRAPERAGGVHRVERLVDPGVLAGRHGAHDLGSGGLQGGVRLLLPHVLGSLDRRADDLGDAQHERPVEHAAERLAVGHPRVLAVPDGV